MQHFHLKNGLGIDMQGAPEQQLGYAKTVNSVALCGDDFVGIQPVFQVKNGDKVAQAQSLFVDRKNPELCVTSPVSGVVRSIETGKRRILRLLVIDVDGEERVHFSSAGTQSNNNSIQATLLKSGLWTAFRTRPFGRIPSAHSIPAEIFVTAIDTHPLAADPRVIIRSESSLFQIGIEALTQLTEGNVYVCQSPGQELAVTTNSRVRNIAFSGPHPAGLAGTHINCLSPEAGTPVSRNRTVWTIDYQAVIAIGELIEQGQLRTTRVVSLAGSAIKHPRLVQTYMGANLASLLSGEMQQGDKLIRSGSVLSGRASEWLGRYHLQTSVIEIPNQDLARVQKCINVLLHYFSGNRAIIAESWLDAVSPLNILPIPLLRSLLIADLESAEKLGALELLAEDLEVFTWACPSQHNYGAALSNCHNQLIESMA